MKRKRASSTTATKTTKKLSSSGKNNAKKKAKSQIVVRRSSRRPPHNHTTRATLTFTSRYTGVATQKLGDAQNVKFEQTATLAMPPGARNDISYYYVYRQQVKDSYDFQSGETQALGAFVQDGPYGPDYEDDVITKTRNSIAFDDTPGFSTASRVPAGEWLESYDVHFRWTVVDKDGNPWTSPEVHHHVESAYNSGADAPVVAVPEGDHVWEVVLPDREPD